MCAMTERIVSEDIYICQSSLIEKCFESSLFSIEDIENLNDEETDEYREIFEWWSISNWLAEKLREHKQPILENDYGTWWGRCTTGQAIKMDGVIEEIANNL
jgi:hypothetical protein